MKLLFAIFLLIILFARHMVKSYIPSGLNKKFVLPRMQYQHQKQNENYKPRDYIASLV